ncbi:MAG: prepilin-type N-terminal cleavage/methylation domain-containing protein [bacterium]
MKINKNKKKALTLVETLVSISIISLLLLVIIQILLLLSKYNKRTGYVQEADLKTKEIAIKIERILYNQEKINIRIIQNKVLQIYSAKENLTLVEFYYQKEKIGNRYHRKIAVYYPKTRQMNFTYLPDNVFWHINDRFVQKNFIEDVNLYHTINYFYNFQDSNRLVNKNPPNATKNINEVIFQHLSIKFYVYYPDSKGREFSKYIKEYLENQKPIPKPLLVYLINIIIVPTEEN